MGLWYIKDNLCRVETGPSSGPKGLVMWRNYLKMKCFVDSGTYIYIFISGWVQMENRFDMSI